MKLIGLCGNKGVGKDLVGQFLNESHEFAKVSFAAPLKTWLGTVFQVPTALFENREYKEQLFSEEFTFTEEFIDALEDSCPFSFEGRDRVNQFRVNLMDRKAKNVREILQIVGTEGCRKTFGKECWVDLTRDTISEWSKRDTPIVITDVRFENEAEVVREMGGQVVRIERDVEKTDTHSSETLDFSVDHVIVNDGSEKELFIKIEGVIND